MNYKIDIFNLNLLCFIYVKKKKKNLLVNNSNGKNINKIKVYIKEKNL